MFLNLPAIYEILKYLTILLVLQGHTLHAETSQSLRLTGADAFKKGVVDTGVPQKRALSQAPLNHAALVGETVVLECSVVDAPPASRVMWAEYIMSQGGMIISENDVVLGHPNADRYRIIHSTSTEFHLEIRDVRLSDGGKYVCQDTISGPPNVFRGEAELIVLESTPNCTTTAPPDGNVLEGQSYTVECFVYYQGRYPPKMTWSGPPPFIVGEAPPNPTSVWSGIRYTVDRTMDTRAFECLTNFTDIGSVPADVANNTPTWEYRYSTPQIAVRWGPKNMFANPLKPEYSVGDRITCYADARPEPFYQWQNMRTLELFYSQTINITESLLESNQTLRCRAQNIIQGWAYTGNLFIPVYVPAPTTTTSLPTTTPTTTQLAESPCLDLTGQWVSQNPYADMILEVVHDSEIGEIRGIMKNMSDTVWVEVVGTARRGDFLYIGLTAIWPFQNGITGMAGECHRCHGTEVLMTESLWRSVAESSSCGQGSIPAQDVSYRFHRISSTTSVLQQEEFDVHRPTSEVSGRLGIRLKRR